MDSGCEACGVGPDDECSPDCPSPLTTDLPAVVGFRPTPLSEILNGPVIAPGLIPPRIAPDPGVKAAFRALLGDDREPIRVLSRAVAAFGGDTLEWSTIAGTGRRIRVRFAHQDDVLAVALLADRLGWGLHPDDPTIVHATLPPRP